MYNILILDPEKKFQDALYQKLKEHNAVFSYYDSAKFSSYYVPGSMDMAIVNVNFIKMGNDLLEEFKEKMIFLIYNEDPRDEDIRKGSKEVISYYVKDTNLIMSKSMGMDKVVNRIVGIIEGKK